MTAIGIVVVLYLLLAYLAAPLFWEGYAKLHPAWEKARGLLIRETIIPVIRSMLPWLEVSRK